MEMSLIPMQHGECLYFSSDKNVALVVDCGSRGPDKTDCAANAKNHLAQEIEGAKTKAALLSHYHADHFNCFRHVFDDNAFDELYIPNVGFGSRGAWLNPARISLANLNMVVQNIRESGSRAGEWIKFLDWIASHDEETKLFAISKGNCFDIGSFHVAAHWPSLEMDASDDEDILADYCDLLQMGDEPRALLEQICNSLAALVDVEEGAASEFGNEAESEDGQLALRLAMADDARRRIADLHSLYDQFSKSLTDCVRSLQDPDIRRLEGFIQKAKNSENNTSIVMELEDVETVLLTGDISKGILRDICKSDLQSSAVSVFKAPHHGTQNRFANYYDMVPFKNLVICNGAKTLECGPICLEYLADAHNYGFRVFCTNDDPKRCSWLDGGRRLPISQCSCADRFQSYDGPPLPIKVLGRLTEEIACRAPIAFVKPAISGGNSMMYIGPLSFKGVNYAFTFDGRELILFPEPDSPKDPRELTGVKFAEGAWGFPGEPISIDCEYIMLHPRAFAKALVVFPLWDCFQSLDWSAGIIHVQARAYIAFTESKPSVTGIKYKSQFLDRCYDVQHIVDLEQISKVDLCNPVALKPMEPTRFMFNFEGERVEVTLSYAVRSIFRPGLQPLQIESEMMFEFSETDNFSFIAGLVNVARSFLRFCTQASDVDFSSIEMMRRITFDDSSVTRLLSLGSLETSNSSLKQVEPCHNRFVPLGVVEGFERLLMQSLANNELSSRHLPESHDIQMLADARSIMLAASFDREIDRLYPEGVKHKLKTVQAIESIDECLANLVEGKSKNSTLSKKVAWLRNILANGDQFSARLLQFYKDHEQLVKSIGRESLDRKGFAELSARVQALRNALAHGSMDIEYSRELIGDMVLLERIVMAVQLLNIGIESDEDVSMIVRKAFGLLK